MLNMLARITKVDEAKRLVYTRIVAEEPDKSGEIFDYVPSKPHFEQWSKDQFEASAGKSYGNVRAMHGKIAAGFFAEPLAFNDTEKYIEGVIKVSDDQEWRKCLDGTYTGASIGGSYIEGSRKTEKIDGKEFTRYTAKPIEVSLVDSPCIPSAKFFDVVKADGTIVKAEFKAPDLEVAGTDDEVAEFARVMKDGGLTMADAIKAVNDTVLAKVAADKVAKDAKDAADAKAKADKSAGKTVDKGIWNVQSFAQCLESLANVARSAQWDLEAEGDASPVPAKLRDAVGNLVAIFKEMSAEEADEMLADLKEDAGEPDGVEMALGVALRMGALRKQLTSPDLPIADLTKIAAEHTEPLTKATLADMPALIDRIMAKAGARHSASDKAHLQAAHDHLAGMGADCASGDKAATGDLNKAAQTEITELKARLAKLEAQPMPSVVTLRMARNVTKAEDNLQQQAKDAGVDIDPNTLELTKDDERVLNQDGSVDIPSSRLMKAMRMKRQQQARA